MSEHRSQASGRERLSPRELAEAAVLADLAVLAVILIRLSPFAGLTAVVGAIPFAVLALRHRARVLRVSFGIAVILVFLLAGLSAAAQVLVMAIFGGIVGRSFRQRWSRRRTLAVALGAGWTTVATLTVLLLAVFAELRRLNLEAARVQWEGMSRGLTSIGLERVVGSFDPVIEWALINWFISVPALQLVISVLLTLFVMRIGRPVVLRVERAFGTAPAPSIELVALADDLARGSGLTVVTGANGSGKTTLLRAIATAHGQPGLPGGAAIVGQRPESQVIGVSVRDDLAWGLTAPADEETLRDALEQVGLVDFIDRETMSLSGGQLQRVALAGATLRRPRLLLSDESTAMIDPDGRRIVRACLRRLADEGVIVVHVSHLDGDLEMADRVIEL